MRTHLVAALGLLLCTPLGAASGCASDAGSRSPGEEIGAASAAVDDHAADADADAGADAYFSAARSPRICAPAPCDAHKCTVGPCGGYLLQQVNTTLPKRHVGALDFSRAGFDAGTMRAVQEAPAGDLVLYGSIGRTATGLEAATFVVLAAFRALPGFHAGADGFYLVTHRDPPIACLVAPCDNEIAERLGTGAGVPFTSVSVENAAAAHADLGWLADRVTHHGAIVAGHLRDGDADPGGPEHVLDASQVFVRLPDRGGPCLLIRHLCGEGERAEYTRNLDRCLVFQRCVTPSVPCLPAMAPRCVDGYTLEHWPSHGRCTAYVCDPAFLTE